MNKNNKGFTLLELIIVLLLVSLILGISAVFIVNSLPSGRFNSTAREVVAAIRHARALAALTGEEKTITISLDSRKYGISGLPEKVLPADINIKVIDPFYGDITEGDYKLVVHSTGSIEGGTIVLWNSKKKAEINLDPIAGASIAH